MEMLADDGENTIPTVADENGRYAFNVSTDKNYTVSGTNNNDYLQGVTTLDVVIIQKYLLGLKEINDPYRLVAADANNNGSISASDLLEIRRVILGSSDSFTNNSWVALSTDYTFSNVANAAQEASNARLRTITAGENTIENANFVAVKIGDLNASAGSMESRNANSVNMQLDDVSLVEGQVVEVPFYASNFNNVYGAQFTMNVSGLNVEDIKAGALNVSSANINIVNNNFVMSWNNANGVNLTDGELLFTLVIRSNTNASLSSILNVNDNVARSEAYTGTDLEINRISLEYRNSEVSYALYQNEPNPFTEVTVIGFDLPTASEYTLTVYDVTGKIAKVYKGSGEAGYNNVTLSKKEISTNGVLYYRLESGDYTATKKMIMIK
jgi:hypothetical protein